MAAFAMSNMPIVVFAFGQWGLYVSAHSQDSVIYRFDFHKFYCTYACKYIKD